MPTREDRQSQTRERREAPRAEIELVIQYGKMEQFCQDYARNLSLGGIFIETRQPLVAGTPLVLSFALPGYEGLIQTEAQVVRVIGDEEAKAQGTRAGMALKFSELSKAHKELIDGLVMQAMGIE